MSVFARPSDVIASHVNALMDRAENPELLLDLVIREMEDALAKARRHAATEIAAERLTAGELALYRERSRFWKARAREALGAGHEDTARRSLARKREHDELVSNLEWEHTEAVQTSSGVRAALQGLEARLAEARRRRRALVVRHRAAAVGVEAHRIAGPSLAGLESAWTKLERLERRLAEADAVLTAQLDLTRESTALEEEFHALETERSVTAEMDALKREVGGS
jgi:phage shock protein A